jgi:hypothetical protein
MSQRPGAHVFRDLPDIVPNVITGQIATGFVVPEPRNAIHEIARGRSRSSRSSNSGKTINFHSRRSLSLCHRSNSAAGSTGAISPLIPFLMT